MSDPSSRYFESHLRTAEILLAHYNGDVPFPAHMKAFFRENPKFGSRDRREIASLCYGYFRLGHALQNLSIRDRILASRLFSHPDEAEKTIQKVHPSFHLHDIFPASESLSAGIVKELFFLSHFIQPDLFIRLRPRRETEVMQKLQALQIPFRQVTKSALALGNGAPLEQLGQQDDAFVVQDLTSQQTAAYFPSSSDLPESPWIRDVCAGSGGKSILAYDMFPKARFLVSDTRPGILRNLETRFRIAGLRSYQARLQDLASMSNSAGEDQKYDLVIVDAPCSGSGTWSRTPWEMSLFSPASIEHYTRLQRDILANAVPMVRKGGYLLYITCSVYAAENEGMADHIRSGSRLVPVRSGMIQGFQQKADTMFAALFISRGE